MNYSIYLYGNFGSGYTQYPSEESTETLFKEFFANAKSKTQIAIHRDCDLMFYSYIWKLWGKRFIGICLVINRGMLSNAKGLLRILEDAVAKSAAEGILFSFDTKGGITSAIKSYAGNEESVSGFCNLISTKIREAINGKSLNFADLPDLNYSISSDSVMEFAYEDSDDAILASSYTYGFTYVHSMLPAHCEKMAEYKRVLSILGKENADLREYINNQKKVIIERKLKPGGLFGRLFGGSNKLSEECDSLKQKLNTLDSSLKDKDKLIKKLIDHIGIPIIIDDIQLCNLSPKGDILSGYYTEIYSEKLYYLSPKIKYTILCPEKIIPIIFEFLDSKGKRIYHTTFNINGELKESVTFNGGFGFDRTSWLPPGQYSLNLSLENKLLYHKEVVIYSIKEK